MFGCHLKCQTSFGLLLFIIIPLDILAACKFLVISSTTVLNCHVQINKNLIFILVVEGCNTSTQFVSDYIVRLTTITLFMKHIIHQLKDRFQLVLQYHIKSLKNAKCFKDSFCLIRIIEFRRKHIGCNPTTQDA